MRGVLSAVLSALLLWGLVTPGVARGDVLSDGTAAIAAYAAEPGPAQDLGAPTGDVRAVRGGVAQNFANGVVYYSPDTGAHAVLGAIAVRYRAVGGPAAIGFPIADEQQVGDGRVSVFSGTDGAAIYWSPATRASLLTGGVLRAWEAAGGVDGPFGFPVSDVEYTGRADQADFAGPAGTQIAWSSTSGLQTVPADLATPEMAAAAAAPVSDEAVVQEPDGDSGAAISWWPWALVAVGIVVLLSLLWWAWRAMARRRAVRASAEGSRTEAVRTEAAKPKATATAKTEPVAAARPAALLDPEPVPEPEPEPEPAVHLSEETVQASKLVVAYDTDAESGIQIAYANNALGGDRAGTDDATYGWLHRENAAADAEAETEVETERD